VLDRALSIYYQIAIHSKWNRCHFEFVVTADVKAVFWNGALLNDADWSQAGVLTLSFTPENGEIIKPI
jgi:hypothetical protein